MSHLAVTLVQNPLFLRSTNPPPNSDCLGPTLNLREPTGVILSQWGWMGRAVAIEAIQHIQTGEGREMKEVRGKESKGPRKFLCHLRYFQSWT